MGPQFSWLETDRLVTEFDAGALETDRLVTEFDAGALETDRLVTEFDAGALETDRLSMELEAGALENDRPTPMLETSSSMVRASARRRRAGESQRGRRAALQAGALFRPVGRRVRAEHSVQRAEAGSDFEAAFTSCDNPIVRLNRVNVILHESQSCCMTRTPQNSQTHHSHGTIARCLHGVHVARYVQNSSNSLGDGVVCLRTWGNKVTVYEHSEWGQAFCCVLGPLIYSRRL